MKHSMNKISYKKITIFYAQNQSKLRIVKKSQNIE